MIVMVHSLNKVPLCPCPSEGRAELFTLHVRKEASQIGQLDFDSAVQALSAALITCLSSYSLLSGWGEGGLVEVKCFPSFMYSL